jgi:hypothetical protein
MEHNFCRENLSAYLDNELSAGEKLALESHLASCADCARELAELKRVSAVFKKHVMQPVPPALKEEVFAEKPAAPVFSGWLKPALVLSATAAGLLIIFGLPKFRQQDQLYSPALFSNAYEEKGAIQAATADKSEGPVSGFSGEMSGGKVSAMSASGLSSPRSLGKGAYGQAKFAGRGSLKAQVTASASSVPLTGEPALVAFFAKGQDKVEAAAPANAGEVSAWPAWLDETIRGLKAGEKGNPPFTIWWYSYKGKTAYYFPPQCCDQYSRLYDKAGKLLCAPDGGLTGLGDGRCADFFKLRKDGVLIWQDQRK